MTVRLRVCWWRLLGKGSDKGEESEGVKGQTRARRVRVSAVSKSAAFSCVRERFRVHVCIHAGCDVVCLAMLTPGSNLGPEGAKALAPSLEQLKRLTTLYLGSE